MGLLTDALTRDGFLLSYRYRTMLTGTCNRTMSFTTNTTTSISCIVFVMVPSPAQGLRTMSMVASLKF